MDLCKKWVEKEKKNMLFWVQQSPDKIILYYFLQIINYS
jgi:hypothetical protein